MRPNFVDVQLDFYGVKDFRGSLEWPKPHHAAEWIKRHYAYSLCDSPFGKYQLAVMMISGPQLVDRMAFDLLHVDYSESAEDVSRLSDSFRSNTQLVSRFEIEMGDLSDRAGWNFYQSQRNLAIDLLALGSTPEAERLLEDADIIKQRVAAELESALQWKSIKNTFGNHENQYPTISSMLIDVFTDYKDAAYDWSRVPEPHLRLVKSS